MWLSIFSVLIFLDLFPHRLRERGSLFIVDVSLSMTVEDMIGENSVRKSRLQVVQDILKNIPDTSQRALMTFAETAKLQLPLSRNDILWDEVVDAITPITYGASTDLGVALQSAALVYGDVPLDVYIFTDGEQTIQTDVLTGAITRDNMQIHIIGVWSNEWGKIINNYDSEWRIVYKKYEWKEILSKLDKDYLVWLQDAYDATLTIIQDATDKGSILTLLDSHKSVPLQSLDRVYYILAWFCILLWLIIPDYRKK